MITTDNNEYLYLLHNLSVINHTFNIFENEIDYVISAIRSKFFQQLFWIMHWLLQMLENIFLKNIHIF